MRTCLFHVLALWFRRIDRISPNHMLDRIWNHFHVHAIRMRQGRIYVGNECPTFLRTMSIVSHKLRILRQIILKRRQICLFVRKISSKYYGITYKFFNYSAPYCRDSKIQHPTSRVVGTFKYAPGMRVCRRFGRQSLSVQTDMLWGRLVRYTNTILYTMLSYFTLHKITEHWNLVSFFIVHITRAHTTFWWV